MMLKDLIRTKREALRLSQRDLARALNTRQPTISRWESGEDRPHSTMYLPLAQTLQIPVEELLQASAAA